MLYGVGKVDLKPLSWLLCVGCEDGHDATPFLGT